MPERDIVGTSVQSDGLNMQRSFIKKDAVKATKYLHALDAGEWRIGRDIRSDDSEKNE